MADHPTTSSRGARHVLAAVYPDEQTTEGVVKHLITDGCDMDAVSVLARFHEEEDDTLGVYKLNIGDDMRAKGMRGAFWGGMWGMLAGAAGMFFVPGVGAIAGAGYIVEALLGGAAVGAVAKGRSTDLSHLATAYHRAGVPEDGIQALHDAVEQGKYVLMVRGTERELERWKHLLQAEGPAELHGLSYSDTIAQDY